MLAKPGPALAAATCRARAHRGRAAAPALDGPRARRSTCTRDVVPILADVAARASPQRSGRRNVRVAATAWLAERCGGRRRRRRARRRSGDRAVAGCRRRARAARIGRGRSGTPGGRSTRRSSSGSAATGSPRGDWPAFLRLAAEMERVAFGPAAGQRREAARARRGRARRSRRICAAARSSTRDGRHAPASDARRASRRRRRRRGAARPGRARARRPARPVWSRDGHARIAPGRRGLEVAADGTCRGARRRALARPVGDRAPDRGLGDRQRHAQPHAAPARRPLGARASSSATAASAGARRAHREREPATGMSVRAGCAGIVPLPARLEPWQERALRAARRCSPSWIEQHGSPLNVIDPAPIGAQRRRAAATSRTTLGVDLSDLLRAQGQQGARAGRRGRPHRARGRRRERARAAAGARARRSGRRRRRDRRGQAARAARALRGRAARRW